MAPYILRVMPHKDKAQRNAYHRAYSKANKAVVNARVVACHRRSRHERYAKLRTIKEMSPCVDCGLSFPYFVMDFDHRDPATKVAEVSVLVKNCSAWDRVLDEMAKCDLVCACCHRLRTYKGNNSYRTRRFAHHRALLDELKATTPCLDCVGVFKPCQMDFDHLGDKTTNIARLVGASSETLREELAKCHLVCANCHRIRTHTGDRLEDPEHPKMLVTRFEEILADTPKPRDKRKGTFPFPELLGTMPDKELAAKVSATVTTQRDFRSPRFRVKGISKEMVAYYRRKAGIPAFKANSNKDVEAA